MGRSELTEGYFIGNYTTNFKGVCIHTNPSITTLTTPVVTLAAI